MQTLLWISLALLPVGCARTSAPPPQAAAAAPAAVPAPVAAPEVEPAASVKPGINDTFLDPELDVDQWVERFGAESREVVARQGAILEALSLQPGDAVADIGAGTGLYVGPFAEAVGTEGQVFAVDVSPRFLERLGAMATEAGWTQVEVVRATSTSTELAPGSIDAAFVCDTYHHFEYPAQTLASLHEALKPGGRLYVLDFERVEGESSEWILGHVRAGREVFSAEIEAAGFSAGEALEVGLEENYLLRFDRP